jgi:large subunit ribosomal protein L6
MSRIGKLPIKVPKNITVNIQNDNILIKGPTGELTQKIPKEINISFNENTITLKPNEDTRLANQKYVLLRSLIKNQKFFSY